MFQELILGYLITLGWALVGAVSMAFSLAVSLAVFTRLTGKVDEWELVKAGNLPMGLIMAAVIIASGIVVAAAIRP